MAEDYKEIAIMGGVKDGVYNQEATVTVSTYIYRPENDEEPGYRVVQIDTNDDVGLIRVYVNDGTVYIGNPEE